MDDARSLDPDPAMCRRILDHAPTGVVRYGRDRTVVYANRALVAAMGAQTADLLDRPQPDIPGLSPEALESWLAEVGRAFYGGERSEREFTVELSGVRRYVYAVFVPEVGDRGEVTSVTVHVYDVERYVRAHERLTRDPLTGVDNRQMLDLRAELAGTPEAPAAVVFVDVDDFKDVNDRHGHAVGDAVLAAVAGRIRRLVRPSDRVVRYGGDEFVVLCERASRDAARGIGQRIVDAFAEPVSTDEVTLPVRVTVGVTAARAGSERIDTLLARADRALLDAKRAGKNRLGVDFGGSD
jgi:diguanylate cyclase (GGDEF)-like protein/PAS domain S-box-containing protein